jgi:hypothetical protein
MEHKVLEGVALLTADEDHYRVCLSTEIIKLSQDRIKVNNGSMVVDSDFFLEHAESCASLD